MEAKFGGKGRHHKHLCGPVVGGKKSSSFEWDLNDWRWDGDLCTATPLSSLPAPASAPAPNCCSSLSDEREERDSEKRRRDAVVVGENNGEEEKGLKLGGQAYPIIAEEGEVKAGKKSKVVGTETAAAAAAIAAATAATTGLNSGRSAVCQVEDCRADLTNAKDYHRRHKVCDMHSKASKALVGSIMQRFCQQCSRFHVLQEFDEGKRSCRRRLAGHNRRRRKTHPETTVNGGSLNDERGSSYLLISLLRILSNMHSNSSDQTKDQDLLSHLLKSLASIAGTVDGRNISALLQGSQGLVNAGMSVEASKKPLDMISDGLEPCKPYGSTSKVDNPTNLEAPSNFEGQCPRVYVSDMAPTRISSGAGLMDPLQSVDSLKAKSISPDKIVGRVKFNDIDLNNIYDDSQDHVENPGSSQLLVTSETMTPENPMCIQKGSHKPSPSQPSQNSDSATTQSPSSSSGEAQDPSDLPFELRRQILNWLSRSPTDIESYIRPGCIILTIYLHLEKSTREELCCDLGSILKRMLDASNDPFWKTGWMYSRVQNYVAFTYNGQLILDTPLPLKSYKSCRISSIKPVAVSLSDRTQFVVKGFNLFCPSTRLLCALDGKYLLQETCYELMDDADATIEHDEIQCLRFSCSIPSVTGRGFIEIEDHGLSSSYFPFIVAEQEVCSELCMLEGAIELDETGDVGGQGNRVEAKNQAMDFIHEMGWLLHRSHVKFRLGHLDPNSSPFPFGRFRRLMEFSMEHDWCFVVKKLLGILFEGTVDAGEHPSIEVAILDMGLLHRAVRRNCRPMVELLLKFVPHKARDEQGSEESQEVDKGSWSFLFKPDVGGPMGLTPLHIAASLDACESVLDALTDDPGKVGVEAWKSALDETGLTPNDYACLRGHYSYIHLVQRKTRKGLESGHVVVNIPGSLLDSNTEQKQPDGHKTSKVASLEVGKFQTKTMQQHCRVCQQHKLTYGNRSSLVYRPAMLSMVAIAAVCVCVALLFKSSPEVLYVFKPFRWEKLKYGSS
ncbi:squamosa promoter-binding-like protein 12 isoform X2 [Morus notabilis]|uniref:squamosa promoter-binding-like protein 12 isoform X2 n=1 Tax=Morus notabilis TaxID=981085 RepID=UPI000CED10D5|nr:squamosa promoter-binding-like protein 12 isoform X2 [Morus notabilis]